MTDWISDHPEDRPEITRSGRWRLGLVAAIAVLALAIAVVGFTVRDQQAEGVEIATRSERVIETLLSLELVLESLLDAETGQRGYLLTTDRIYLAPYEDARARLPAELERLRALLDGEVALSIRLDAVVAAADAKLAELAQTVTLHDGGDRDAALELVRSNVGRGLMEELRAEIGTMRGEVAASREATRLRAEASARRVARGILSASILFLAAAALTGVLAFAVARDRTLRATLGAVRGERDRVDLLRRELAHRIKNLFAVVSSIATATAREHPEDGTAAARATRERIDALGRAHTLSIGDPKTPDVAGSISSEAIALAELAHKVVSPYGDGAAQLRIYGDVVIREEDVTPLGLILNELATNARKYGGFAGSDGSVRIDLSGSRDAGYAIAWDEIASSPVERVKGGAGFGSRLLDSALQQIGGRMEREATNDGLRVTIQVDGGNVSGG